MIIQTTKQSPRNLKKIIYFMLIMTSFTCITYLFLVLPNLSRQKALVAFQTTSFAHRGLFDNRCYIPENSLAAFQKAIDYGYGIEMDVQLTKDKVPVVAHDYNLKRVCGEDVLISSLTFEELSKYTLFNSSEHIPSLEEALNLIDEQVPIMVEIKAGFNYHETCKHVNAYLSDYNGIFSVIAFSPLVLQWFKEHNPDIIRGQLSTNHMANDFAKAPITKFLLTHLMLNCLSRPDLILYNAQYEKNFSLNLCKKLFNSPVAIWTIKNEQDYHRVTTQNNIAIFDNFSPYSFID